MRIRSALSWIALLLVVSFTACEDGRKKPIVPPVHSDLRSGGELEGRPAPMRVNPPEERGRRRLPGGRDPGLEGEPSRPVSHWAGVVGA